MALLSRLRVRVGLIIAVVLVPMGSYVVYTASEQRRADVRSAIDRMAGVAWSLAHDQSRVIDDARTLLGALVVLRRQSRHVGDDCSAILAEIRGQDSRYASLAVLSPSGYGVCSALPTRSTLNSADRAWFRRAVSSRGFAVGEYQVGRVSGKPSLGLAVPVIGDDGKIEEVVYAALDLEYLGRSIDGAVLPPGATFTLIDRNGTVLARHPDAQAWVGQTISQTELYRAVQEHGPGSGFEAVGLDGRRRLFYAFELAGGQDSGAVHAAIGIPAEAVTAESRRQLRRSLAAFGILALILFGAGILGAERLISRPVSALMGFSRRLGAGDLGARTNLRHDEGDMGELAANLDAMAASLQHAQRELRYRQEHLTEAQAIARCGNWRWAVASNAVEWSDEMHRIFGVDRSGSAPTFDTMVAAVHIEDRQLLIDALFRAVADKAGYRSEFRLVRPDGEERCCWVEGRCELDGWGEVAALLGICQDVTDRRKIEQEREQSQKFLEVVLDSIEDGIAVCDGGGRLVLFNRAAREILGVPGLLAPFESGNEPYELLLPDGKTRLRLKDFPLYRALSGRDVRNVEIVVAPKDGVRRTVLCAGRAILDAQGRRLGAVASMHDITDRKLAEEELRASEERYRQLVELTHEAIWVHTDGKLTFANSAAARLLGAASPDELVGRPALSLFHLDDMERAAARARLLTEERRLVPPCEMKLQRLDGGTIELEMIAVPFVHQGKPSVMAIGRDVTERSRIESQLRQSQKMEAVGRLTGGVAHDFNNLLTVILGNLQLLQKSLPEDARARKKIAAALAAARRGADLISRLLTFARQQVLEPEIADANELVNGMGEMLRRSLGESVEVRLQLAAALWAVRVDLGQLEAAILNLAINARDAMADGGVLTIQTANVTVDEASAAGNGELAAGDHVVLTIGDTGAGMSPKVVARAFEPFFTTKGVGKGTGLGLAMVYGFVKQSGGHVRIESVESRGTTVRLYLPRAHAEARGAEASIAPRIDRPSAGETILVVEDDAAVRETIVELLEDLGYRVLQADDGSAALAIIDSQREIELLLTDIVMPGEMNGIALARQVLQHRPRTKVLFTSGYTEHAFQDSGHLEAGVDWIAKPYTNEDLGRKVRRVLDSEWTGLPVEGAA